MWIDQELHFLPGQRGHSPLTFTFILTIVLAFDSTFLSFQDSLEKSANIPIYIQVDLMVFPKVCAKLLARGRFKGQLLISVTNDFVSSLVDSSGILEVDSNILKNRQMIDR